MPTLETFELEGPIRSRDVPVLNLGDCTDDREAPTGRPSISQLLESISQKDIADTLANLVDQASKALDNATEDGLSDQIESALRGVSEALDDLSASLPKTPEECEQAFQVMQAVHGPMRQLALDAEHLGERGRQLEDDDRAGRRELTRSDALDLVRAAGCVLSDVRAALDDVSREEIEEVAEVALTVARVAVSYAQVATRRMQHEAELAEATVTIEEVGEGAREAPPAALSRTYMWRPLWPRLKAWVASPEVPKVPAVPRPYLLACLAVGWPMILLAVAVGLWSAVFILPWVLLIDAALQELYMKKQRQVEDFLQSGVHVVRLWYLSARLVVRRFVRIVRLQLRRALKGRTLEQVTWECFADPLGTLMMVVEAAVSGAIAAWASCPPRSQLSEKARALWTRASVVSSTLF